MNVERLAATGIDGEPGDRRQVGTGNQHHIGAVHGERAARYGGLRSRAREVEHAECPQAGRSPLGHGSWRRLADIFDAEHGQTPPAPWLAAGPTIPHGGAHQRDPRRRPHRPRFSKASPSHCISAACTASRSASQPSTWQTAGAMMREIGVQGARNADRGSCRFQLSHPRPAAAACRRRADNVRCGIRRTA